ncbi:Uncharacterised protein [Candidatus Tiddalikarchaeum anstoanum]|nr:Uncharacterised protein [Candidatus Tiddalikarchaeum anstoanum]
MSELSSYKIKLALIGPDSLKKQAVSNYNEKTLGLKQHIKRLELDNGTNVFLTIWNTSNLEKFKKSSQSFKKGSAGLVQLLDEESINAIDNSLSELDNCGNLSVLFYFTGSVSDKNKELIDSKIKQYKERGANIMLAYESFDSFEPVIKQFVDSILAQYKRRII